jgi:uncharacterized membrane protein YqgA involved in biofilm formation
VILFAFAVSALIYIGFGAVIGIIVGSRFRPPAQTDVAAVCGVAGLFFAILLVRYGVWQFWKPKEILVVVVVVAGFAGLLTFILIKICRFLFVRDRE